MTIFINSDNKSRAYQEVKLLQNNNFELTFCWLYKNKLAI